MKALSVDCASSCMTICAKNDDDKVSVILDIGPKQSSELLPAIDYVLKKISLTPSELDYTVLTKGPGTFTGLRLAFAALKAIQLNSNTPVYGVSTLECYAWPFKFFKGQVITTIDAKKNQFFAAIYKDGKEIMSPEDTTIEKVYENIDSSIPVLCAGPDAKLLCQQLKEKDINLNITYFESQINYGLTLFELAEQMIAEKKEPLKDFEGPEYLRKSEAELALESK